MGFGISHFVLLLLTATVVAGNHGSDKPCFISCGTEITEVIAKQYNPLEPTGFAITAPEEKPLHFNFPTQTQNQTPEAAPNKNAQKRTDSSTPGTQILSPWRQVVGGIAVAVLVAVV